MERRSLALVLTVTALVGCGGGLRYMRPQQPPQAIQPLPDQAVVVFMRPSNYGRKARFTIIDGQGRFLGEMQGRQYFITAYPPGQYEFAVHAENNDLMQANLTAGRVYYVLVGVRMGAWSARSSISALTERREEWANREEYLAASRQMVADMAAGQAGMNPAEVNAWLAEARQTFASYGPDEQSLRVLGPTDGLGPGPQAPPPAQPTQPPSPPVQTEPAGTEPAGESQPPPGVQPLEEEAPEG